MMLSFLGLGLNGRGLTLRGFEEARDADRVYAELYTSLVPELDLKELEEEIGNSIKVLDREDIEQSPEEILESAKEKRVAFLVPGDPMVATTHVDLRLRAEDAGVETKIVHGPSIETAAPGLAGLQSYKFGRTTTLPLPRKRSEAPYEILEENQERGLHTLFLLDIEAEEERYLTADLAIEYLLDLEGDLERDVYTGETLSVVVGRAGTEDPLVKAGRAKDLLSMDFESPPQVLIVPGRLHFLEGEALEKLAGASKEAVRENVEG